MVDLEERNAGRRRSRGVLHEREGRPPLLVVVRWRLGGERLLPPSAMGEREQRKGGAGAARKPRARRVRIQAGRGGEPPVRRVRVEVGRGGEPAAGAARRHGGVCVRCWRKGVLGA